MILFIRKHPYILFFVTMSLFGFIWDYISGDNLNLLENFLYALWLVIVYAFIDWAWDSKKYEKK